MMRWLWLAASVVVAPVCASAQPREAASSPEVEAAPSAPPAETETDVAPSPEGAAASVAREPSASHSVGVPNRGRLRASVELDENEFLFIRRSQRHGHFGTAELVGVIQRAARAVGVARPGPKLVVGDLSRRRGGRFSPHRSHQSGRDADIGFYMVDEQGAATQPPHFIGLRRSGCGTLRGERYCIDPARNWALLVALATDETTRVQYILVAPDIRQRVIAEGEREGAPSELLDRVRTLTRAVSGSHSHRSHFHIRIYCPVDDRPGCIDEAPFHPWYEGTPAPPTPAIRTMRARQRRARARRRTRLAQRRAARERRQRRVARARRQRLRERRRARLARRRRRASR